MRLNPTTLTLISLLALGFSAMVGCGDLPDPVAPGLVDHCECDAGATSCQYPNCENPDCGDASCEDNPNLDEIPPDAPNVATVPANYGYLTIPMRGQAEAYSTIFIEGGKGPVASDADSSGHFCIDVGLHADMPHTLQVFAQDASGNTSDSTDLVVRQDSSLAQVEVPDQPLVDVAPGADIYSDVSPYSGLLSDFNDENPTTWLEVDEAVIWLDLGVIYDIERIELTFPGETGVDGEHLETEATEYEILASADTSPVFPPDRYDYSWTLAYDVFAGSGLPGGDGGVDTFEMPADAPIRARYVAVYLIEDGNWDYGTPEDIRIAEISIMGRSIEELAPVPMTPTCANGRSLQN
ncbi:hypothetical protein KAI87_13775 [Myxococcota bacterium]|nr:hypothetical protein [Myxococcota bacterium]